MNPKAKELNRLNNELDHQINEENQQIFTDMICYIRGSNISEYDQEMVRQDLTEMILSAQKRGETIHTVIGNDYKEFCDSVIASLPPKTLKRKIIDFLDIICCCISILGAINIVIAPETIALIHDVVTRGSLNFEISISVGSIVSMGVILVAAVIIVEVILKSSFKIEKKGKRAIKGFAMGAGGIAVFLLIAWLGKKTLFTMNIFLAVAIVLGLFAVHKILERL